MELKARDPIARKTSLGWICFGPTLTEEFRRSSTSYFTRTYRTNQIEEQGPDDILRQFWELVAIGIRDETDLTPDEKAAVAQVTETLHLKKRSIQDWHSMEKRRTAPNQQLRNGFEQTQDPRKISSTERSQSSKHL
jgi:hypothetical protein